MERSISAALFDRNRRFIPRRTLETTREVLRVGIRE
jgi:hypothetical protein